MKVFIVGIAGGVGRRLAQQLIAGGHQVGGLVRRQEKIEELAGCGISASVGDLAEMSVQELAAAMKSSDALVFSAGAGGRDGSDATTKVDGEGPPKVAAAMIIAGVRRLLLVSVFPEAWRERPMPKDFEHYMAEKKKAETELVRFDVDWIILRPSALTNDPGCGRINLSMAETHGEISREDVAATLMELLLQPAISRIILEVTNGPTAIGQAVSDLVR